MPRDTKTPARKIARRRPLILLSNDDGIAAPGLQMLASALRPIGRVVVVAPDREQSAASHALTLHKPLRIDLYAKDQYAVNGTPTDCITLGINTILKTLPDLVVSGVNRGANLGDDLHYSGTVAAALEGAIFGVPAIAVSQMAGDRMRFDAACAFAARLARIVLREGLPPGVLLNVNVPNLPKGKIRGYECAIQGKRNYGDVIVEKLDPRGKKYYWIGGNLGDFTDIAGSDCNVVQAGKIAVTPVNIALTDHHFLQQLKTWQL